MATDVIRYEAWPDFSFDDPLFIEIVGATLPYILPEIWMINPADSDDEKVKGVISTLKESMDHAVANPPFPELFVYKEIKNDYIVGITVGLIYLRDNEKILNYAGFFLRDDENGSRDYARRQIGSEDHAWKPLADLFAQHGISNGYFNIHEGHPKVSTLRERYGLEPVFEMYQTHWKTGETLKMLVYDARSCGVMLPGQ